MRIPAFFHDQDLISQRDAALETVGLPLSDWDPVPAVLPAGGVSVHDWRTLHGCEYSNGLPPSHLSTRSLLTQPLLPTAGPNNGSGMRCSLAIHFRTGRSWPRSHTPGERYLDQFLHDRRRHCCPVLFGDPTAIRGDKTPPIFADSSHAKL